jgi:signal transduction histidine kinase
MAANRAIASILDTPPGDLVGRPFEELLSMPGRILFQTHVYPALLAQGHVEEVFLTLGAGGGDAIPILLNARRSEEPGDVAYVMLVVRIRARAQWEQELLAATRALEREEAASRRLAAELATAARDLEARYEEDQRNREFRDAFVGVISHELRTPITTIYGMSHLLRKGHQAMDPAAVAARLEDIETEADRLHRLTEDLLVLSRAEGGRLVVAEDPLVIGRVLEAAVRGERSRSQEHAIELAIDPDLPLVMGERTYVEQVTRNFLSNAVKYSPAGSTVWVTTASRDGGVDVRVTDEGLGFGDDDPDRLWDLFYRAKGAIQKAPGAGIGLFVSRALIEAMGGRVWARSASDPASGGAEFGFWLPAAAEPDDD